MEYKGGDLMNDKKKVTFHLIENAKTYAEMADGARFTSEANTYSLVSIAHSLLCIVEMLNDGHTKVFWGDDE